MMKEEKEENDEKQVVLPLVEAPVDDTVLFDEQEDLPLT
jgi:hypothetical protein